MSRRFIFFIIFFCSASALLCPLSHALDREHSAGVEREYQATVAAFACEIIVGLTTTTPVETHQAALKEISCQLAELSYTKNKEKITEHLSGFDDAIADNAFIMGLTGVYDPIIVTHPAYVYACKCGMMTNFDIQAAYENMDIPLSSQQRSTDLLDGIFTANPNAGQPWERLDPATMLQGASPRTAALRRRLPGATLSVASPTESDAVHMLSDEKKESEAEVPPHTPTEHALRSLLGIDTIIAQFEGLKSDPNCQILLDALNRSVQLTGSPEDIAVAHERFESVPNTFTVDPFSAGFIYGYYLNPSVELDEAKIKNALAALYSLAPLRGKKTRVFVPSIFLRGVFSAKRSTTARPAFFPHPHPTVLAVFLQGLEEKELRLPALLDPHACYLHEAAYECARETRGKFQESQHPSSHSSTVHPHPGVGGAGAGTGSEPEPDGTQPEKTKIPCIIDVHDPCFLNGIYDAHNHEELPLSYWIDFYNKTILSYHSATEKDQNLLLATLSYADGAAEYLTRIKSKDSLRKIKELEHGQTALIIQGNFYTGYTCDPFKIAINLTSFSCDRLACNRGFAVQHDLAAVRKGVFTTRTTTEQLPGILQEQRALAEQAARTAEEELLAAEKSEKAALASRKTGKKPKEKQTAASQTSTTKPAPAAASARKTTAHGVAAPTNKAGHGGTSSSVAQPPTTPATTKSTKKKKGGGSPTKTPGKDDLTQDKSLTTGTSAPATHAGSPTTHVSAEPSINPPKKTKKERHIHFADTETPPNPDAILPMSLAEDTCPAINQEAAAGKIQAVVRRFLAQQQTMRMCHAAALPPLPSPLIPPTNNTPFMKGFHEGAIQTMLHPGQNLQKVLALQNRRCEAQREHAYAHGALADRAFWDGYAHGIGYAQLIANVCYQKGYYSSGTEKQALATFVEEFKKIKIGYRYEGYPYFFSAISADLEWSKRPDSAKYLRTDAYGNTYYEIPQELYYEWAMRPNCTSTQADILIFLTFHFTEGYRSGRSKPASTAY